LGKSNDAFIVSSYLPFIEEIKLQLSLGQCPQLWTSPSLARFRPDIAQRELLTDASNHEGFERFVRELLWEVIPSCYVEGFSNLIRTVDALPWPTQPKFIYTANNFDLDEVFKVWTANKIADGVPYYVGQHGAGYGTHKFFQTKYAPERAVSDRFLTWGWTDADIKSFPAYVFNAAGRKLKRGPVDGGLLLIQASPPHQLMHWDSYFEFGIFQEEQFRFVEALPNEIHQLLTVRLHSAYKHFRWSDEQRWEDRSPSTRIDTGSSNIRNLVEQSRLVVHAYDSTGILEGLALNIPTLCFWHGGLDHLLPEVQPYYQLLIDAGILLDSPEHAAEHVAMVWNDVEGWWTQSIVQEARKQFCDRYAKVSQNPVRDLKKMLQE
jgi:putative transferase (TIGR04331 family)